LQVFNKFADLSEDYHGCEVALGTFDGIHLGHLDIINTAKNYALKHRTKSVVFSFSNHPLDLIAPERTPTRLCSESKKKALLKTLSVDALFNMRFDKNFASVSSQQFVLTLKQFFSPSCIVIGNNYSYGYLGAGTAETLKYDGEKYGFDVIVNKLVKVDNIIASSTNIRSFLIAGDIGIANKLLGRFYTMKGKVMHGDARGRILGFPTANIKTTPHNQTIPGNGVYWAIVKVNRKSFKAVINVGTNPTFTGKERRIEAHILDFQEDIYDKTLEVALVDKIRNERKFANAAELIKTIKKDIKYAREHFHLPEHVF
jgi:riboflavin kinase/FMN adenylyltransferase